MTRALAISVCQNQHFKFVVRVSKTPRNICTCRALLDTQECHGVRRQECKKLKRDRKQCLSSKRLKLCLLGFSALFRELNWCFQAPKMRGTADPSHWKAISTSQVTHPLFPSVTVPPSGSTTLSLDCKGNTLWKTDPQEIGGNNKCRHKNQDKSEEIVVQKHHWN